MSTRIELEDWLLRMTQAKGPGPAVHVVAYRGGNPLQWRVELGGSVDLGLIADRIDDQLRDEVIFHCELQALDTKGELVGKLQYDTSKERTAQIMPQATSMISARVEDTVEYALRSSRSFAGLGFKAVIESYEMFKSMMGRLEKENAALRTENSELRKRISDLWELESRIHSEHIDKQVEADRSMRHARMAETFMSGLAARFFGRNTPEGHAASANLAGSLLRSINPEQAAKIWPLLTDEQRAGLAVLMQEEAQAQEAPTTAHDAAVAASAVNGKGARG